MEQGTYLGNLIKGFVGQPRGLVGGGYRPLFFDLTDFFPDNLPDGLPELLRFIWEQHGSNWVIIANCFFHHLSF